MPPREEAHLAECLVIDLVEVAQEVLPAIDVGELLHDPEGVDVVLGDIDGDGCEHREASRQPGRERDRGGLTGFEGDGGGRKAVVPGKGEAGLDRGGLLRQGNGVVVGAELAQFLPQVVVPVDLDAAESDDLLEKLGGALLGLLVLLGRDVGECLVVAGRGFDGVVGRHERVGGFVMRHRMGSVLGCSTDEAAQDYSCPAPWNTAVIRT